MTDGRAKLEMVVTALASQCDGARRRDGRGFSRADAQEGARLSALTNAGIPWTVSDAKRAMELASRHPVQAASLLGRSEKARKTIEALLREGKIPPMSVVGDSEQRPYNFCSLSSGGRNVYLWKMSWIEDLSGLLAGLSEISRLKHGERLIRIQRSKPAEITINGARKRFERWEIPYNGTTLPHIMKLAADHSFILDPAVGRGPDPVVDELRRHSRACWIMRNSTGSGIQAFAVFDLDRGDKSFAAAVKQEFKGKFSCTPSDDWNWTIEWSSETAWRVARLAQRFGFACDRTITKFLQPGRDRA